jgi:hypothetical protein
MGIRSFNYDAEFDTFTPEGTDSNCGFACHSTVAAQDYIYTAYLKRRASWRRSPRFGLLVIILVAIATSGRQRIKLCKPIDEPDRIDERLYLPETLYAFMLIINISAGAGPYSLDALILGLTNMHIT